MQDLSAKQLRQAGWQMMGDSRAVCTPGGDIVGWVTCVGQDTYRVYVYDGDETLCDYDIIRDDATDAVRQAHSEILKYRESKT